VSHSESRLNSGQSQPGLCTKRRREASTARSDSMGHRSHGPATRLYPDKFSRQSSQGNKKRAEQHRRTGEPTLTPDCSRLALASRSVVPTKLAVGQKKTDCWRPCRRSCVCDHGNVKLLSASGPPSVAGVGPLTLRGCRLYTDPRRATRRYTSTLARVQCPRTATTPFLPSRATSALPSREAPKSVWESAQRGSSPRNRQACRYPSCQAGLSHVDRMRHKWRTATPFQAGPERRGKEGRRVRKGGDEPNRGRIESSLLEYDQQSSTSPGGSMGATKLYRAVVPVVASQVASP